MGWREIMAGQAAIDAEEEEKARGERLDNDESMIGPAHPTGKANRLAVTALICAAAIPFLLIGGILGAVFGFVALDEIEESQGAERGKGMAYWAIALGFLNIAVSCAAIAFIVAAVA